MSATFYSVAASPGNFIRVGAGVAAQRSIDPDYFPWVDLTTGVTEDLLDIVYTGQSFVAVGKNGTIVRTIDGTTWTVVSSGTASELLAVAAGFPVVIAVGKGGVALISSYDGQTFIPLTTGTTTDLYDVTVQDGYYIIVGDNNYVGYGELVIAGTSVAIIFETISLHASLPVPPMAFSALAQDTIGMDEATNNLFLGVGSQSYPVSVNEQINLSGVATKAVDGVVSEIIAMPHALGSQVNGVGDGDTFFAFADDNINLPNTGDGTNTIDLSASDTIALPNLARHDTEAQVQFAFADDNINLPHSAAVLVAFYPVGSSRMGVGAAVDVRQFRGFGEVIFVFANDNIQLGTLNAQAVQGANMQASETIALNARAFDSFEKIAEAFKISSKVVGAYHRDASDSFTLHSSILANQGYAMTLSDAIAMTGTLLANQGYSVAADDQLTLHGAPTLNQGYATAADDSFSFHGSPDQSLRADAQAEDAMSLHGSTVALFILVGVAQDTIALDGIVDPSALLNALATDTIAFSALLSLGGAIYDAWVINPENRAVTQYRGFNFESMCASELGVFATDGSTIYELTGDDDAGVKIDAWFRTNVTDFGSAYLKNVERAYLGLHSSGRMLLKTIANGVENWYEVRPVTDDLREVRVKFGKGNKARFWQFEIRNIRGSDFDLESLVLVPIRTGRRVN